MTDTLSSRSVSQAVLHADYPGDSESLDPDLLDPDTFEDESSNDGPGQAMDPVRVARLVQAHHAFVWRSLRRLGVIASDVDDATQKVFLAATRKCADVPPPRERSFLFATAVRIAANERRAQSRRRYAGAEDLDVYGCEGPSPEQTTADRALLDKILAPLPLNLRSVFILFELEQMTKQEIAAVLDLPEGTVASRLRRARELVEATIARLRAAQNGRGAT